MLKSYLKKIFKTANQGDAREESYYSTLESLLKEAAKSFGKQKIHITTLPKSTEAGNPDFRVWDGKQHIVGYIEAKAPTIELRAGQIVLRHFATSIVKQQMACRSIFLATNVRRDSP